MFRRVARRRQHDSGVAPSGVRSVCFASAMALLQKDERHPCRTPELVAITDLHGFRYWRMVDARAAGEGRFPGG